MNYPPKHSQYTFDLSDLKQMIDEADKSDFDSVAITVYFSGGDDGKFTAEVTACPGTKGSDEYDLAKAVRGCPNPPGCPR